MRTKAEMHDRGWEWATENKCSMDLRHDDCVYTREEMAAAYAAGLAETEADVEAIRAENAELRWERDAAIASLEQAAAERKYFAAEARSLREQLERCEAALREREAAAERWFRIARGAGLTGEGVDDG